MDDSADPLMVISEERSIIVTSQADAMDYTCARYWDIAVVLSPDRMDEHD